MTTSTVMSNVNQNIAYALSEMGEVATFNNAGTTLSTKKDVNGTVVLAGGSSIAAAITHVLPVHPQLNKITN